MMIGIFWEKSRNGRERKRYRRYAEHDTENYVADGHAFGTNDGWARVAIHMVVHCERSLMPVHWQNVCRFQAP